MRKKKVENQTKLLNHFILRTFTFSLSALLIPHASAPYNAVGTNTPSYRHFFAFICNPLLFSTLFSAPHALYPLFILCTTATCDPRYLKKTIHFSNGSPFSLLTCIRHPFPYTLYSYQHSLSTFFFRMLYETHSPVYTTSPLN